jgi:hypothetical protein
MIATDLFHAISVAITVIRIWTEAAIIKLKIRLLSVRVRNECVFQRRTISFASQPSTHLPFTIE